MVEKNDSEKWDEFVLSNQLSCVDCGTVYESMTPRHFFVELRGRCLQSLWRFRGDAPIPTQPDRSGYVEIG